MPTYRQRPEKITSAAKLSRSAYFGTNAPARFLTSSLGGAASEAGAPGAAGRRLLALSQIPPLGEPIGLHRPQARRHDAERRSLRRILPHQKPS